MNLQKRNFTTPKVEEIKKTKIDKILNLDRKVTTVVTPKFEQQYQYLCKKINTVEWSGILFYTVEGTVSNIKKVTLEEIFLMDKGTGVTTDYSFDEEVVEHMMNNPYLQQYRIGHVHSHNNMGTFFSGTDMDELKDNASNHLFYLSIIVNNYNSIVGKVAIFSEATIPSKFKVKNEEGADSYINLQLNQEVENALLVYDCVFEENPFELIEESFKDRLKKIIAKSEKKTSFYSNPYTAPFQSSYAQRQDAIERSSFNYAQPNDFRFHKDSDFLEDDFTEEDVDLDVTDFFVEQYLTFILLGSVGKSEVVLTETEEFTFSEEFAYIYKTFISKKKKYDFNTLDEVIQSTFQPFWEKNFVDSSVHIQKLIVFEQLIELLHDLELEIFTFVRNIKEEEKILHFIKKLIQFFEDLLIIEREEKNNGFDFRK